MTVFFLCLCVSAVQILAQKPEKPKPEITKMMKEVSAKNIEATIRKLVTFGTRNTLSEQDNPTRGVGAARERGRQPADARGSGRKHAAADRCGGT